MSESLASGQEKGLVTENSLFNCMTIQQTASNSSLFNPITIQQAASNSKLVEAIVGTNNDYVLFGELSLPAVPSMWSVLQVVTWASKNGATEAILDFIKRNNLDGHAFLMIIVDDFMFPSMGHRIRFGNALEKLRRINEEQLRTREDSFPP
ncbi:hypothetical protein HDU99_006084, partial [Rhizoclosmatium hyalinum]